MRTLMLLIGVVCGDQTFALGPVMNWNDAQLWDPYIPRADTGRINIDPKCDMSVTTDVSWPSATLVTDTDVTLRVSASLKVNIIQFYDGGSLSGGGSIEGTEVQFASKRAPYPVTGMTITGRIYVFQGATVEWYGVTLNANFLAGFSPASVVFFGACFLRGSLTDHLSISIPGTLILGGGIEATCSALVTGHLQLIGGSRSFGPLTFTKGSKWSIPGAATAMSVVGKLIMGGTLNFTIQTEPPTPVVLVTASDGIDSTTMNVILPPGRLGQIQQIGKQLVYVVPTQMPTNRPSTMLPTNRPTTMPTNPTTLPTNLPTNRPTTMPTNPTTLPTNLPTTNPTMLPTNKPTTLPTNLPTANPTMLPTNNPTTQIPTTLPTKPTTNPTTKKPTKTPTKTPTTKTPTTKTPTTKKPTKAPTTTKPTKPTKAPTTKTPTKTPTIRPTQTRPTLRPTRAPTCQIKLRCTLCLQSTCVWVQDESHGVFGCADPGYVSDHLITSIRSCP